MFVNVINFIIACFKTIQELTLCSCDYQLDRKYNKYIVEQVAFLIESKRLNILN